MRSFQQIVVFLFALLVCAFAADTEVYDATVYVTSTVYRVNTVTMSGSPSGSVVANQTSTISAPQMATYAAVSSLSPNGTSLVHPSGSAVKPSASQFTGAASVLNINAYVAAFAACAGYLVL
jgi:hypothetical protein